MDNNDTEYLDRFMRDFLVASRDSPFIDIVENMYYYSKVYEKLIYDREEVQDIRHVLTDITSIWNRDTYLLSICVMGKIFINVKNVCFTDYFQVLPINLY
jgi:hypothetical protein